jgi:hypothetical protein
VVDSKHMWRAPNASPARSIRRGQPGPRAAPASAVLALSCSGGIAVNDTDYSWPMNAAASKPQSSNPPALNRSKRASCIVDAYQQPTTFRGSLRDPRESAIDTSHGRYAQRDIDMGGPHSFREQRTHLFLAQARSERDGPRRSP